MALLTIILMLAAQPTQFDVAAIKPSSVTNGDFAMRNLPGGRLSCMAVTLKMLMMQAYNVKVFQISGGPSWIGTAVWDIEAKVDGVQGLVSRAQQDPMLRALIEDRFNLKVRVETKEMPIFARVVGKGGPRLTPHTGEPAAPGERLRIRRGLIGVKQGSTAILADRLERELWRPVVDKTDIKGAYDYTLTWAPEPGQGGPETLGLPPQQVVGPHTFLDGPSIFTALQEQLGLRLESQKGPAKIVVIDSVDKPSEN